MGSGEHYCLRWNNHQSNLLGVFSQLLRDESLVDVTLACSEGHSIRAHRVVLSACSSYFQTLFLDHPSRHPIVILKDVRFAELRTLIEFMYKGEVNVEYCQLSALLKTAESLKVKGLAEMTTTITPPVATVSSNVTSQPEPSGGGEPDLHQHQQQQQAEQREREREREREQQREREQREREQYVTEQALRDNRSYEHNRLIQGNERIREREHLHRIDYHRSERKRHHHRTLEQQEQQILKSRVNVITPNSLEQLSHRLSDECVSSSPPQCDSPLALNTRGSVPPLDDKGGGTGGSEGGSGGTRKSESPDSIRDECIDGGADSCEPNDLSVNNNSSSVDPGGGRGSVPTAAACPTTSRLPSPHAAAESEPVAGPSGLPPVQQVPLSLKKEVDWGGGSLEDSKTSADSLLEYRHPYEPDLMPGSEGPYPCMYCGAAFAHQSKLTRHILSHSLETLKYREQLHQLQQGLGPPPPPPLLLAGAGGLPPPGAHGEVEHAAMELELEAAAAAVAAGQGGGSVVLCKFCGKSFPDVGTLIAHLPAHTGDRPFKCEFCGKAFKLRHHMKDHCRVHTGERPFRCSLCGKTFSRSTILKAHEKTHYPKYVRKFLSPGPLDSASAEDEGSPQHHPQ